MGRGRGRVGGEVPPGDLPESTNFAPLPPRRSYGLTIHLIRDRDRVRDRVGYG